MSVPTDTLDFLCEHRRLYIVDDGLVSGTMTMRCQDCPREMSKEIGSARRSRPDFVPAVEPMWCEAERRTTEHRKIRRSHRGVSLWRCESCGGVRNRVTPS